VSARLPFVLERTFEFEGQAVRYGVWGAGTPLVFVHGTPFSSHVWHRIAPLFEASHRVFCFDLLGSGQSEKSAHQDVSLGVQNRLLTALLAHWDAERPDIVAHDFGGATALRTHLLNGADYRSLTLIDPVALAPWGSPFAHHVREHEGAFSALPPYIHPAIVAAYIRGRVTAPSPRQNSRRTLHPGSVESGKPPSIARSRRCNRSTPMRSSAGTASCAARR
jgi:pimeloyl-ACP methyl ester carboxylesterase